MARLGILVRERQKQFKSGVQPQCMATLLQKLPVRKLKLARNHQSENLVTS
jgi:hypothetical protein